MDVTSDFSELCNTARESLRGGDYAAAIKVFEQARQLDDAQSDLHEGLATAHFLAGNYDDAVTHFKRVAELKPRRSSAYINLGAVFNRMGAYQKAVEALRRGIQIDKRSAEGYYNLGIAHRKLNQMGLAIPAYREAIRLDPQMVEAYQNLGNVYLEMGNTQQALVHFKKALEINPNFERARLALQKAEKAASAKETANPFGRLVAQLPEPTAQTISHRTLSAVERDLDRKQIQILIPEIRSTAKAALDHLRQKLEPGIRDLNRSLTHGVGGGDTAIFEDARSDLKPLANKFHTLSRTLQHAVADLRKHESQFAK